MKQKNYRIVLGVLTVAALGLAGCNSQGDSADKDGAAAGSPASSSAMSAPSATTRVDERSTDAPGAADSGQAAKPNPTLSQRSEEENSGSSGSGTASTGAAGSSGSGATSGSGSSASGDNSLPRQRSGLAINQTAPDSQVGGVCGTVYGATIHAGVETSCSLAVHTAMLALAGTHPSRSWTVTAQSSQTGRSYTMNCGISGDTYSVYCENPGGTANVSIVSDAPNSWEDLVQ